MSGDALEEIPIDVRRTDQILRFIRKNPNCTKASVIRHMKGKSSINTTHYILLNLIDKGKLNVNKINTQTHLLSINDSDVFNIHYKTLLDFEQLLTEMADLMQTVKYHNKNPALLKLFTGLDGIENSFRVVFGTMLTTIYSSIMSGQGWFGGFEGILFSQIDDIYQIFVIIPWDNESENEVMAVYSKKLEERLNDYNRKTKVKTNIGDNLIKLLQEFKVQILDEYGH